jgi:hypothetical protein
MALRLLGRALSAVDPDSEEAIPAEQRATAIARSLEDALLMGRFAGRG